jgi:hypothetical protein
MRAPGALLPFLIHHTLTDLRALVASIIHFGHGI